MTDIKNKWRLRDRLLNGVSEDGHFRASVLKASNLLQVAKDKHELNPLTTLVLGRLLISAALSTTNLKGEERISFRLEGDGGIGMMTAEANALGEIRGFCSNPNFISSASDSADMVREAVGDGVLHFTKVIYGESTPYVSSVPVAASDVVSDVSYFYAQSEQLPTAIKIDIDFNDDFSIKHAHGLIVQALPEATDAERASISTVVKDFPSLTTLAEDGLYVDGILNKITLSSPLKETTRRAVDFYCSCSKDRFAQALGRLDKVELIEMSHSEQEMKCHYCNTAYVFSSDELKEIASDI